MFATETDRLVLTPCQATALEKMQGFYGSDNRFFLLQGGAGTGKSTAIREFIDRLKEQNSKIKIAASAPTHKAVGVLREMGETAIDCGTIHSLLGLTLKEEREERVLEEGKKSRLHQYHLVIVDESSMISAKLWDLLQRVAESYNTKFIFVGDIAQLPPINEARSPVFDLPYSFSLTKIVRQAQDNPLMPFISAARGKVFDRHVKIPRRSNFEGDKGRGAWVLERRQWLRQLIRAFQSPKAQKDPNYVRAIAWTNAEVDRINWVVRDVLYNASVPFLEGERLIAKEAVIDPTNGKVVLPSCAELVVVDTPQSRTSEEGIHYWKLKVEDDEGRYRLQVPDPREWDKIDRHRQKLAGQAKKKRNWGAYWDFRNRWANLKPCYGITSHQSQGSTYENAFVCDRDISCNPVIPEQHQARYVAFSRARSRLFVTQ